MGTGAKKLLITGFLVLVLGTALNARAQTAVPCEPSEQVKQALQNLPESTGDAQADRAARVKALRALIERFPDELFSHQRYQDTASNPNPADRDAVIAEYRELADKHPRSALYAYLAARSLVGRRTKEVLPQLVELSPEVPSGYLQLVQIYQSPNFKDAKKARENLEAFMKACPASLRGFTSLRSMEPSDFLKQSTERLRALLKDRTDAESLSYYSTLWALEFRVKPAPEHEALRKQVAEDLTRLRGIDPGKNRGYFSALAEGYKLTADKEAGKWVTEQVTKLFPASAYNETMFQWNEQNPFPKESDPPEKRKAFNEARAKVSAEWIRQWPEAPYVAYTRVSALKAAEKAEPAEVETAGEAFLKAMAKNGSQFSYMSYVGGNSPALMVADLYADKGVRLDRLPELVKQGVAELAKPRQASDSDLYTRPAGGDDSNREFLDWYGTQTIADIWLKVKDKDRAHEALQQLQATLEKLKPKPDSGKADAKDPQQAAKQRTYLSRQVEYWRRMGDLGQLQDRRIDAMTFYQNALLARAAPPTSGKDELAEKARALWQDIGGSNEGWQAWFTRKDLFGQLAGQAAGTVWTKMDKPLPEFELADMSGAKWRLANLKGKTTLIGIWATW